MAQAMHLGHQRHPPTDPAALPFEVRHREDTTVGGSRNCRANLAVGQHVDGVEAGHAACDLQQVEQCDPANVGQRGWSS